MVTSASPQQRPFGPGLAMVFGLIVVLLGSVPWSILLGLNLKMAPSFPFAPFLMAAYLAAYWSYLNSWGWPRRTADARRASLRARWLSGRVAGLALLAGCAAIASAVLLLQVYSRMVHVPVGAVPDFSRYSAWTIVLVLLTSAAVAGISEEAGFRGYMQSGLEHRFGPVVAISLVAVLFAAAHLTHGVAQTLPLVPYYLVVSTIYSLLAYTTQSILPGLVLHCLGDALQFLFLWRHGAPTRKTLVWQTGTDAQFWTNCLLAAVCAFAAVWLFAKLAQSVRVERAQRTAVSPANA